MSIQISVYTSSIANTAADQQIVAVADGLIPTRDNALVVPPSMPRVIAVMFFGANLTVAKLKPASYRRFGDYWILPYTNAAAGAGAQMGYSDLSDNPLAGPPLMLDPQEELPAYAQQGSAGAQQAYAAVIFSEGGTKRHSGRFFTVRATGTTTLVPNAWSTVLPTMDTGLPAGRYNLVGMRVKSAGALFFRAVIVQQFHRPGGFAVQNDTSYEANNQRHGGWGIWGNFDHLTIPNVEIFSTSADTSETIWFDLEQSTSQAVAGPPTQPYHPVQ